MLARLESLEDRRLLSVSPITAPITPTQEQTSLTGLTGVAQAVSLSVSTPTIAIAGSPFNVTVTAVDQNGQPVTTFSGLASLTSSNNETVLISAANVNLTNGAATVAVTLNTPNTLTLSAASGTLTGTSSSINVTPPVTSFAVSAPTPATAGFPFQAIAGTPFSVTVQALDQYGNIVSGYAGPVSVTSSDEQTVSLVGGSTLSGGTGTFQVALNTDT
jgi:hypothetical protein